MNSKLTGGLLWMMALAFSFSSTKAQTAEQVIARYIDAIGGPVLLRGIKTEVIKADVTSFNRKSTKQTTLVTGSAMRMEVELSDGTLAINVITPTSGWTLDQTAGMTEPQVLPADKVKSSQHLLQPANEWLDYKKNGQTILLVGRETIAGTNVFKIRVENKDGARAFCFFDAATYYLVRTETIPEPGYLFVSATVFSDYRRTAYGTVVPFNTVYGSDAFMTIQVVSAVYNKPVDPMVFKMPR